MKIAFSEVDLSELDLLRLKAANVSDAIMLDSGEEKILMELGLIERISRFGSNYHYSITSDGKLYLNYLKQKEKSDAREQDRWVRENKREWIGIAVSGGTAILSLVIAAISLVMQVISQSGSGC